MLEHARGRSVLRPRHRGERRPLRDHLPTTKADGYQEGRRPWWSAGRRRECGSPTGRGGSRARSRSTRRWQREGEPQTDGELGDRVGREDSAVSPCPRGAPRTGGRGDHDRPSPILRRERRSHHRRLGSDVPPLGPVQRRVELPRRAQGEPPVALPTPPKHFHREVHDSSNSLLDCALVLASAADIIRGRYGFRT